MIKIKYDGKVKEYSCDFCERKAIFTEKTTDSTDTMFFCLIHKAHKSKKEIIVRSGLVNTDNSFIALHLFKGIGNAKQAIQETKNDIRQAISMKDKHQEKLCRYKLEQLELLNI